MNDFKEDFVKAMGQLSADRDVVSSAKIRAEAERPQRKMSAKRILGTAAAVCGVLVCGVTAAGAAGLIDFDAVFGERISVSDSELAGSLVGTVENFKYKISDSDYKIELKGVTGDDKIVLAIAEISSIDGTPITDCFINHTDENLVVPLWERAGILGDVRSYSTGIDHNINKAGNIEIYINFVSDDSIDGKTFTYKGENFYPLEAYNSLKFDKKISYLPPESKAEDMYTGYAYYDENGEINGRNVIAADVDDIGVIALDMEYEFSFTYTASNKSTEVRTFSSSGDSIELYQRVYSIKDNSEVSNRISAALTYIEAGSTSSKADFEYEMTDYNNIHDYGTYFYGNEMYIILNDGERIRAVFDGGTERTDGNICKCSYNISYRDENDHKMFVNVDDIKAISINGTVYELN